VRRAGSLVTALIAWVGVVSGHLAACLLAYPDHAARHDHLAAAGHSWVTLAVPSLVAAVPVILLLVGVRAIRKDEAWSGSGLAVRLTAIQVPAFVLIELAARDVPLGSILAEPATFIGLVLQPVVAVLAAWLLDLFRRAVLAVVHGFRPARRSTIRPVLRPALPQIRSRHFLLTSSRRRAPPLPAAA
jgi:hypothetical protein